MSRFFVTDGQQGHKHFAYVNTDTGVGVTTLDKDHVHSISFNPELGGWYVEADINPKTGKSHVHVLYKHEPQKKKRKADESESTDEDVVRNVLELFEQWVSDDEENIDKAVESERFVWGEQWDDSEKALLESQGRSALTINVIERMVDTLLGMERQNRSDLKYLPQEGGDQRVADILNHLVKFILEKTNYPREKSKGFEDAVVVGRGCLNVDVSFKDNLQGDIVVEKYPWTDVVYAPHEKEDLEDCDGLIKHRLYSVAKLKSLYPKFADKIQKLFLTATVDAGSELSNYDDAISGKVDSRDGRAPISIANYTNIDIARKSLRVFESWRKVYSRVNIAINPSDGYVEVLENWEESDVSKLKSIPNIHIIDKEFVQMRVTTIVGDIVLSDEFPADLPVQDFYVIPMYGKKKGGQWKGRVWSAIDMQKQINKRRSQVIDIGNQSGYGWLYDDMTFGGDSHLRDEFLENISSPNFVCKVDSIKNPPVRVEGIKFPAELVRLIELDETAIRANLALDMPQGGANESGSHFMQKRNMFMAANEFMFDNLGFAQKKLGKLLVGMIQKYYPAERIARILNNKAVQQGANEVQVGGQPISSYSQQELQELIDTSDLALYDVEVSESSYSPTAMLAMFMALNDMAKSGLPVPPELLVEFIDAPFDAKSKAKGIIEQQRQTEGQAAESTQRTEVNKSLLGQGLISQEVQDGYQPKPIPQFISELQNLPQDPSQGQQMPTPGGLGMNRGYPITPQQMRG